jgi:putative FmdB family regulatory protein
MPIYEYKCKKCGASFEALVKNDREKIKCSKCSAENPERQLSVFSAGKGGKPCPSESFCPSAGNRGCGGSCGCAMKG